MKSPKINQGSSIGKSCYFYHRVVDTMLPGTLMAQANIQVGENSEPSKCEQRGETFFSIFQRRNFEH